MLFILHALSTYDSIYPLKQITRRLFCSWFQTSAEQGEFFVQ